MPSNLELYEELKKTLTEDAARMIAEVIPPKPLLATKDDIVRLEKRLAGIETKLAEMETRLVRWTLTFFVPLWLAVLATLVTIVLRA